MRILPMILLAAAILPLGASGCVREIRPQLGTDAELPPDLPHAGSYHGVTLHFEITAEDIPEVKEWLEKEGKLPPLVPEILPGGREVYRVGNLHRVDFHNAAFEVGGYSYRREQGAHLNVYKRRDGNLKIWLRKQPIVVVSDVPWSPSVYYYRVQEEGAGGRALTKEFLKVGLAEIETVPAEGFWLVNDKRYHPDPSRPLELHGAVHATVAR